MHVSALNVCVPSGYPELVLQMFVKYIVGAGSGTQVLCKGCKCSEPLSYLSCTYMLILKEGRWGISISHQIFCHLHRIV